MNSTVTSGVKLSTLDLVFSVMDSSRAPLDFTLLFHLKGTLTLDALRRGARSARCLYPTSGSYIEKKQWVRFNELTDGVEAAEASPSQGFANITNVARAIEDFLDSPMDLRTQMPVQQLVIGDQKQRVILVTRFHHAVGDGLSAAMWLGHQLRVAYGQEQPVINASHSEGLRLKTLPSPVKRSRYAYAGPSDVLWTSSTERTGARRWLTIDVEATALRARCRNVGFTYNDLLATCALEVFTGWNRMHCDRTQGVGRRQKIGLWLPINIRQRSFVGFGNGTSRIRLYARYASAATFADKCREVRRQISWSTRHGEWNVPEVKAISILPQWLVSPLLRCYLNRPSADMATGVFSHADRWTGTNGKIFDSVEKIECVGLLHPRQSVAINGATHQGRTWLTFTYDPGLLSAGDAQELAQMYREQVSRAQRELT